MACASVLIDRGASRKTNQRELEESLLKEFCAAVNTLTRVISLVRRLWGRFVKSILAKFSRLYHRF